MIPTFPVIRLICGVIELLDLFNMLVSLDLGGIYKLVLFFPYEFFPLKFFLRHVLMRPTGFSFSFFLEKIVPCLSFFLFYS